MSVITTNEITKAPAYRFPSGCHVIVTNGLGREVTGTVLYVKLAPPDYVEPLVVTVDLDPAPGQVYRVRVTAAAIKVRRV